MKKMLLGTASAAAVLFATPAMAQDQSASPFAGPYVGAQVGVGQIDSQSDDLDGWYDSISNGFGDDRGIQAGGRVGYDIVSGDILLGALAEGSLGKLNAFEEASSGGDDDPDHYKVGTRLSALGSIRGKLGVTSGRVAAFATGGLAFSNGKHRFRETDGSDEVFDGKADRSGYVWGIGGAYALSGNSNIALEYSAYRFGSRTNEVLESDGGSTDYFFRQDYRVRNLMLSYNYSFGANRGAAPAVEAGSFAGPYIGLQVGGGRLDDNHTDLDYWYTNTSDSRTSDDNLQFGLRGGYDFVMGSGLIAGVLGEFSVGKFDAVKEQGAELDDPQYRIGTKLDWVGSVRGKLGLTSGNVAAFVTAGLAFSDANHRMNDTDGSDEGFRSKADRTGYVLGLGGAYSLNDRVSFGLDYSHYEFGSDRNEVLEGDGEPTDYFYKQDYKVRALTLSLNYGF